MREPGVRPVKQFLPFEHLALRRLRYLPGCLRQSPGDARARYPVVTTPEVEFVIFLGASDGERIGGPDRIHPPFDMQIYPK